MRPITWVLVLSRPALADQVGPCSERYGWFDSLSVEEVLDDGSTRDAAAEAARWPDAFATQTGFVYGGQCLPDSFAMPLVDGGSVVIGCEPDP